MHTMRSEKEFWYKCLKPNCQSTFQYQLELDRHMRIHNNDLQQCQYCPYRYIIQSNYEIHLRKHFGIKDFKCDQCESRFLSQNELNRHYSRHEGIIYCCLICNTYEAISKHNMEMHLRIVAVAEKKGKILSISIFTHSTSTPLKIETWRCGWQKCSLDHCTETCSN